MKTIYVVVGGVLVAAVAGVAGYYVGRKMERSALEKTLDKVFDGIGDAIETVASAAPTATAEADEVPVKKDVMEYSDEDIVSLATVASCDPSHMSRAALLSDNELLIDLVKGTIRMGIEQTIADTTQRVLAVASLEAIFQDNEKGIFVASDAMYTAVYEQPTAAATISRYVELMAELATVDDTDGQALVKLNNDVAARVDLKV